MRGNDKQVRQGGERRKENTTQSRDLIHTKANKSINQLNPEETKVISHSPEVLIEHLSILLTHLLI